MQLVIPHKAIRRRIHDAHGAVVGVTPMREASYIGGRTAIEIGSWVGVDVEELCIGQSVGER